MLTKKQLIRALAVNAIKAVVALTLSIITVSIIGGQIEKIGNSLITKRSLAFVLERHSDVMEKLKKDFAEVGRGEEVVKSALPPVDNIAIFIDAVNNLQNITGLQQSATFGEPVLSQDMYIINFNLGLQAGMGQLVKFLQNFESLPYMAQIDSVTISGGGQGIQNSSTIYMPARFYAKQP
jgi:Tfp pilus assembly protein PilO